jgi:hypothetical protein
VFDFGTASKFCDVDLKVRLGLSVYERDLFYIRKDQAFSCWLICSSCQMDKKLANMNPIKNDFLVLV